MRYEYFVYKNFKSFFIHTRNDNETVKVANILKMLADGYEFQWVEVPEGDIENFDRGGTSFRIWGDEIETEKDAKRLYREIKIEIRKEEKL